MSYTRKQVEASFGHEGGRITDPGRFEGSPLYGPYFWDAVLEGGGDWCIDLNDDTVVDVFRVQPSDEVEFPELEDVSFVTIQQDNNGFIWTSTFKTEEEVDANFSEREKHDVINR